jgi:ADP-ribose pyrophosphatase
MKNQRLGEEYQLGQGRIYDMSHPRAWTTLATRVVYETPRLRVHRDDVTRPDGEVDHYDWVEAPDQVRVAALVSQEIIFIEQSHYLTGATLQLPGGSLNHDEDSRTAAQRELRQETGYRCGSWTSYGQVCPLPSLSPVQVHLWLARDLAPGQAEPESPEADLRILRQPLTEAVEAVREGRVCCAASTALILAVSQSLLH